jgi:type II secretion system protein N
MKLPRIPLTLTPRMRKVLSYSGYPLFYVFCLLLFAYFTFPYERLKERVIAEFEAQRAAAGSPQMLEIQKLGPYWLSGVRAKGVKLISVPTGADAEKPPSKLELDDLHVRVSIFPLIIGRLSVTFGAKAFGGSISGFTRTSGSDRIVELEADDLDVGTIGPLADTLGLPLFGTLGCEASLTMPEQKLAKAAGSVECKMTDLALGDGKAKIQGKLVLPRLTVGELVLTAEAKDGILRVSKLAAAGKDLDLAGEGKISLRDPFGDSLSDLYLRFRFAEAYKGKNDITKSLFGSAGSSMPALFELADPRIKASKRADGFYGWHMAGQMKDPRFEASPQGGGAASGRIPAAPVKGAPPPPPVQ